MLFSFFQSFLSVTLLITFIQMTSLLHTVLIDIHFHLDMQHVLWLWPAMSSTSFVGLPNSWLLHPFLYSLIKRKEDLIHFSLRRQLVHMSVNFIKLLFLLLPDHNFLPVAMFWLEVLWSGQRLLQPPASCLEGLLALLLHA